MSKKFSSTKEDDFEVQDADSASITEEISDTSKEDTKEKPEKKVEEGKETKGANAGKKDINDANSDENAEEAQGDIIVPLESIVVNLGGVGSRRYLRVLINLEVENEDAQNMIKEKIVMLRDKMISLLSTKTANEIETEGSLLRLRLEIKSILNELLGSSNIIKKVYFSDFIVQ